eukprot:jgi/Phyca11/544615/estExt2_Genewise1Plus.C_PHYCAscaffold_150307
MTAPTVTTGPCEISEGDAAVGIAAIVDNDCLYGGLGCFSDHCRFCKLKETPESTAFVGCADFNGATITTDGTTITAAPTTAPTLVVTTTTNAPATSGSSCSLVVSEGDASVGINIVSDASCASGGVGCIDNVCRFCRSTTTVQSAAFTDCNSIAGATVTTNAPTTAPVDTPTTVSDGDAAVGINIVTDTTCANGGAGCIDNVCRFCKVLNTIQSAAFVDCTSITSHSTGAVATTDAPTNAVTTAPTDAPTAAPTDAPTNAPVAASTDAPATPTSSGACTQTVSDGDAAVGINIVTDTSCANGGVGCIDNVCRFCKTRSTDQSAAFLDCPSV